MKGIISQRKKTNYKAKSLRRRFRKLKRDEKRVYTKVLDDERCQLLKLIQANQITIKSAALGLGINYSTAKNIVKVYRKEKRFKQINKGPKSSQSSSVSGDQKSEKFCPLRRFTAKKTQLEIETTGIESPFLVQIKREVPIISQEGIFDFHPYGIAIYAE